MKTAVRGQRSAVKKRTARTVVMPLPIRVVKAGFGYQICTACTGNGCAVCKGMGEVPKQG